MRYLRLFESFEDIDEICRKYIIRNYTINLDGSIDVVPLFGPHEVVTDPIESTADVVGGQRVKVESSGIVSVITSVTGETVTRTIVVSHTPLVSQVTIQIESFPKKFESGV
mgnify:CR=1 FL=1